MRNLSRTLDPWSVWGNHLRCSSLTASTSSSAALTTFSERRRMRARGGLQVHGSTKGTRTKKDVNEYLDELPPPQSHFYFEDGGQLA